MAKTEPKEPSPTNHASEPIDERKELRGRSRSGGDAPPEVQQKIIDMIIEEARSIGLNNRETAYYIAIAKRESGFNPDAASTSSTASGIAQVLDKTGETFGVNASNRFNARASIKAGLGYFKYLRDKTLHDHGSIAGEYEPIIYNRYHYGEFSTERQVLVDIEVQDKPSRHYVAGKHIKRGMRWRARPFEEIKASPHYKDSKLVVDEAARIEKILNDAHGLKVQLTDITGKPMGKRTVIVVTKTEKKASPSSQNASAAAAIAAPAPSPTSAINPAPPNLIAANSPQISTDTSVQVAESDSPQTPTDTSIQVAASDSPSPPTNKDVQPASDTAISGAAKPVANDENSTKDPSTTNSCGPAPSLHVDWVLNVSVFETDDNGNLPEIESTHSSPVMVLIPRPDYEAYNDAVQKNLICESGNVHQILPHDDEIVLPPIIDSSVKKEFVQALPASAPSPVQTKKIDPPKVKTPAQNIFDTASKPKDQPSAPSKGKNITFSDVAMALRTVLGWEGVYESTFSYIKQFYTRPKLPDKPLDNTTQTMKGEARLQVINSSLLNKDIKTLSTKDQVSTAKETAVKTVAVSGDAPWMDIALAEQKKKVHESNHRPSENPEWVGGKKKRDAAIKSIEQLKLQLTREVRKKGGDPKRIGELESEIREQGSIRDSANKEMLDIESKYNSSDILKYLNSTSLAGSELARSDHTAWCSSFANWCIEQSGFRGTHSALADSWVNWGQKIDEPRYGAVTVVKRGESKTKDGVIKDLFHVGFYTGIVEKNRSDGIDEIEIDGKVVKRQKFKKVKYVRLLSGNMSNAIMEYSEWTLSAADDSMKHFVSYHWPTLKEKIILNKQSINN